MKGTQTSISDSVIRPNIGCWTRHLRTFTLFVLFVLVPAKYGYLLSFLRAPRLIFSHHHPMKFFKNSRSFIECIFNDKLEKRAQARKAVTR